MKYTGETKLYECDNGKVYRFPKTHCVFCKHCTDLFYDYTNGPYMFICDFDLEPNITETTCECEKFEDDGYEFDAEEYENRISKLSELKNKLKSDVAFNNLMDKIAKKILLGDSDKNNEPTEPIKPIWETDI